jgi:mono/diheme cytochrome c family protein
MHNIEAGRWVLAAPFRCGPQRDRAKPREDGMTENRSRGALLGVLLLVAGVGCEIGPRSGAGLRLPNGDVVAGRAAFQTLGCPACHAIEGEPESANRTGSDPIVVLGGHVAHIKTHGELVTAIVNPSHGIAAGYPRKDVTEGSLSRMRDINDKMTVAELIDVTEYLQSEYELSVHDVYRR